MACLGYDRVLTRHMRVRVSESYAGTQYVISCWRLMAGAAGDKKTEREKGRYPFLKNKLHAVDAGFYTPTQFLPK